MGVLGDRAKFGLTIPEIIEAVDQLTGVVTVVALPLLSTQLTWDAWERPDLCGVSPAQENMKYLDVGGGRS